MSKNYTDCEVKKKKKRKLSTVGTIQYFKIQVMSDPLTTELKMKEPTNI